MPEQQNPHPKIMAKNLWKIFGSHPQRIYQELITKNLPQLLVQTGHVAAVREVSFEVFSGEIFVIMGLSGSGKSTLIRCISRLIEPTAGQIFIDNDDITQMKKAELRHLRRHQISMVFQQFGLFPHRRVIENTTYGLEIQGVKKKERMRRGQEILELVGLKGWERYYPHQLSGGMQQRVGLARALAVEPEILLCDEPFSALDPLIRREMQDELLRLQRVMKKTIIFITHDFLEATKLGDRIAIMKDGVVVQMGTPQQIVAYPTNDYVREFAKDVPRSRILTAQSIMRKDEQMPIRANTETCSASTTLEALIPLIANQSSSLVVVNDNNEPLGIVDRDIVFRAIAGLA